MKWSFFAGNNIPDLVIVYILTLNSVFQSFTWMRNTLHARKASWFTLETVRFIWFRINVFAIISCSCLFMLLVTRQPLTLFNLQLEVLTDLYIQIGIRLRGKWSMQNRFAHKSVNYYWHMHDNILVIRFYM